MRLVACLSFSLVNLGVVCVSSCGFTSCLRSDVCQHDQAYSDIAAPDTTMGALQTRIGELELAHSYVVALGISGIEHC